MLPGSSVFSIEEGVDFEPVVVWQTGEDGKSRPTNRQAVDASGTPLWRLAMRAKVLKFGRVARVDASVTVPSMTTLHVGDIPSARDAVQDDDVIEIGQKASEA